MVQQVEYERLHIRINKAKERDIIQKLEQVKNKSGYIKGLIKQDIKNSK